MKQTLKLTLMMVLAVFLTFCSSTSSTPKGGSIDAGGDNEVPDDSDFGKFVKGRVKKDPNTGSTIYLEVTTATGENNLDESETKITAPTPKWKEGYYIKLPKIEDITLFSHGYNFKDSTGKSLKFQRQYFDQNGKAITGTNDVPGGAVTQFIVKGKNSSLNANIEDIDTIFEAVIFTDPLTQEQSYTTGPPVYIKHV